MTNREYKNLVRKIKRRENAFKKAGLPTGEFTKLKRQIEKNTGVKYGSGAVARIDKEDLQKAGMIYSKFANRETTTVKGYLTAEKKRIKTWELDLNADVKKDRKVMNNIGKLMNNIKPRLEAYGYDSHMLKNAITDTYNNKKTLQSVSPTRLSKLLTNYINAEGENLLKNDVDELISNGYITIDGKKYTYTENGRVEYKE